jgi:hypothetical protein
MIGYDEHSLKFGGLSADLPDTQSLFGNFKDHCCCIELLRNLISIPLFSSFSNSCHIGSAAVTALGSW